MKSLILLTSFVFAASAWAKPELKETVESEKEVTFSVPVPKPQIAIQLERPPEARPTEFGFAASSWVPSNLSRGSYTGETSTFQKTGAPAFGFTRYGQLADFGAYTKVNSAMGLSYLQMERSKSPAIGTSSTEDLNLIMAKFGIETEMAGVLPWHFVPTAEFALLPTWMTAEKSTFEDSVGEFGWPMEASVGVMWRSPYHAGPTWGQMSLGVSYMAVRGSVAGSSLKGNGVQGEFRITL